MRHLLLIGALALTLSACDSTESGENETLRLSLSSAEALLNGFHYEGWAIIDGTPVSTGKFNVDGSSRIVDLDGDIIPNGDFNVGRDLSMASAIVITIEPDGDTDALPATTKFMGGDLTGTSTNLMADHGSSLGDDFTSAAGTYILATPTDGPDSDENSGVWFLDLSSGTPSIGLDLPTLPEGWKYEGWAVIDGQPVTSGTFTDAGSADENDPFSGPMPGPNYPGEDYLVNAPAGLTFPTDLAGGTAVISIEPFPDDSPAPFTFKPLVGSIPQGADDHANYDLNNNAAGFPTGTASIN